MPEFMPVDEAIGYFGLRGLKREEALDKLEAIVLENDLDVQVDNRGNLVAINASEARKGLFEEHKKEVGHRPDHPVKMAEALTKHAAREQRERETRKLGKERLQIKREGRTVEIGMAIETNTGRKGVNGG